MILSTIFFAEFSSYAYLFFSDTLLSAAEDAVEYLAKESAKISKNLLFFVGLPVKKNGALYNCAAAVCGGKIRYLPNFAGGGSDQELHGGLDDPDAGTGAVRRGG